MGIRRANGEIILQTNPDIYFTQKTINNIEKVINNGFNSIITCGSPRGCRIDIPPINNYKSIIELNKKKLDEHLNYTDINIGNKIIKINSCALGDFMLFKKNNVMKSRGFKECPLAPYHIEQPFVDAFKQQKIYEQSIDDIKIFHFDHSRLSLNGMNGLIKKNPDNINLFNIKNNENWGCWDYNLTETVIRN